MAVLSHRRHRRKSTTNLAFGDCFARAITDESDFMGSSLGAYLLGMMMSCVMRPPARLK
jgi:hypothetical protein